MTHSLEVDSSKNKLIVGISDLKVSSQASDLIITYSLGSCLGLSVYDPVRKAGGILHAMLSRGDLDSVKSKAKPAMFVDTGIIEIFTKLEKLGCNRKNFIVKAAGCGSAIDTKGFFEVGKKNFLMMKKILWMNNLLLKGQVVGGSDPKTLFLDISTGKTYVKSGQNVTEL
ncbi:MAG: chemotaxis protein CheD [Spirochaetales bacterium]|nr:chemotaxis protein CheD [Spirochaetales bacterium]